MLRIFRILPLGALLLSATAALAQQMVFQLDPAKSTVEFTLGATLHTVHGKFRMKDSVVRFDMATGIAAGALVVDATSGISGNGSRDRKMNKDILESARYPEFRFTVQNVRGNIPPNGTAQVQMIGIMSLHGGDHPMTVTAPLLVNNGVAMADVHFEVPYVKWGLKDPSTFLLRVDKEVDIVVHAVGSLSP